MDSSRLAVGLGTGALAALVTHGAPWISANESFRLRWCPGLAGIGRTGSIALTFDDGPDPTSTPLFLDALGRLGWQATFFVLGDMTARHPDTARAIVAAGHEIGVHGQVHRSHLFRTPLQVLRDLRQAKETIHRVTGAVPRFVRPPYGTISAGTLAAARTLDLQAVLWSAWGRDWRADATPLTVMSDLRRGLRAGATLLLHDADCASAPQAWRSALGALPLLAVEAEKLGLRPVGLSAHLSPVPKGSPGKHTQDLFRTRSVASSPCRHTRGTRHERASYPENAARIADGATLNKVPEATD